MTHGNNVLMITIRVDLERDEPFRLIEEQAGSSGVDRYQVASLSSGSLSNNSSHNPSYLA